MTVAFEDLKVENHSDHTAITALRKMKSEGEYGSSVYTCKHEEEYNLLRNNLIGTKKPYHDYLVIMDSYEDCSFEKCPTCGIWKDLHEFYDRNTRRGRCEECRKS